MARRWRGRMCWPTGRCATWPSTWPSKRAVGSPCEYCRRRTPIQSLCWLGESRCAPRGAVRNGVWRPSASAGRRRHRAFQWPNLAPRVRPTIGRAKCIRGCSARASESMGWSPASDRKMLQPDLMLPWNWVRATFAFCHTSRAMDLDEVVGGAPEGNRVNRRFVMRTVKILAPDVESRLGYGMRSRWTAPWSRSEEHTSELQSLRHLVCRL